MKILCEDGTNTVRTYGALQVPALAGMTAHKTVSRKRGAAFALNALQCDPEGGHSE